MKKEVSKKNTKPKKEEKYKIFDSVKLKRTYNNSSSRSNIFSTIILCYY